MRKYVAEGPAPVKKVAMQWWEAYIFALVVVHQLLYGGVYVCVWMCLQVKVICR